MEAATRILLLGQGLLMAKMGIQQSAPLLFSSTADVLLYIMLNNKVSWEIYYLNAPNSLKCVINIQHMQAVCREAGLPLAHPRKL